MNCSAARAELLADVDGELGLAQRARLHRHLELCPSCRRRARAEDDLERELALRLARPEARDAAAWTHAVETALPRPTRRLRVAAAALLLAASFPVLTSDSMRELASRPFEPDGDPMKTSRALGGAALIGAASVATTAVVMKDGEEPPPAVAPTSGEDDTRVARLVERQTELEATIRKLEAQLDARSLERDAVPATEEPAVPMFTRAELDAAVARALADAVSNGASPAIGDATFDATRFAQRLLDPELTDEERDELWRAVRENGQIDAVVAEFERRAELAPYYATAQYELGVAYHQKMLTESGPEAGKWGAKGAASYERALELDELDWDARFALARHEYWAGLGGDAVRDFEVLIAQQKDRLPEDKHAGAYLWLGNIRMDNGDAAAAKELWAAGLKIFPDDAALRARLEAFE